jgi:hypothetical protein
MPNSSNWIQTLAKHDTAIEHLGSEVRTLKSEVHQGFSAINTALIGLGSKFDKMDAQPKFDFHRMVSTVVSLAGLFALICGGIIYITNSQNAALIAEQKAFNASIAKLVERHEDEIDTIRDWKATVTFAPRKKD